MQLPVPDSGCRLSQSVDSRWSLAQLHLKHRMELLHNVAYSAHAGEERLHSFEFKNCLEKTPMDEKFDTGEYETLSDRELEELVQSSFEVGEAIFLANPMYAEDAGFAPFSRDWVKRYWKSLLSQVSGKPLDMVLEWALAATAAQVSAALVAAFGISVVSYPAAIALAVLLIRAAREENSDEG